MGDVVRIGGHEFPAEAVVQDRPVGGASALADEGSKLEEWFASSWRMLGFTQPVRELEFHPERRWRFDFAWPEAMVAVEVEGGVWSGGRHLTGAGFIEDAEKYNAAAALGWCVQRWPGDWILDSRGRDAFDVPRAQALEALIDSRMS